VKQSASEILKEADRMKYLSASLIFHLSKNSLGLFFGVFSTETTWAEKIQVCVHE
jgi:hypothetical protein